MNISKLSIEVPEKKEKKERPHPGFCSGKNETWRRYRQIRFGLLIPSDEQVIFTRKD